MQPSLFTKIIEGEIPAHRVYEDAETVAFLDIHPVQPGHTLVVPKMQIDRLEEMTAKDYHTLMSTVKKLMKHLRQALQVERVCLKVEGFDVPHVHVHLIPCNTARDFWAKQRKEVQPDHTALAKMAETLRLE